MASIQSYGPGEGRVRVQMYIDQAHRRLDPPRAGRQAIDDPGHWGKSRPCNRACADQWQRRLSSRAYLPGSSRWSGLPPVEVRDDRSRFLHRTDGTIVYGQLTGYASASRAIHHAHDGATETEVPADAIADLFLSAAKPMGEAIDGLSTTAAGGLSRRHTVQRHADADRGRARVCVCPGVKEPLTLPLADVRSLIPLGNENDPVASETAGRGGRLDMEGLGLKGRLVRRWRIGRCSRPHLAARSGVECQPDDGRVVGTDRLSRSAAPQTAGSTRRAASPAKRVWRSGLSTP